jgi:hypothetical protein
MDSTEMCICAGGEGGGGEGGSHAIDVILLCVGASQEKALRRGDLVRSVCVHAWGLSVEGLPDLNYGVPGILQAL